MKTLSFLYILLKYYEENFIYYYKRFIILKCFSKLYLNNPFLITVFKIVDSLNWSTQFKDFKQSILIFFSAKILVGTSMIEKKLC